MMIIDEIQDKVYGFIDRYGWRPNTLYMNNLHRVKFAGEMQMMCLMGSTKICGLEVKYTPDPDIYVGLI